jgi:hypothetical protein
MQNKVDWKIRQLSSQGHKSTRNETPNDLEKAGELARNLEIQRFYYSDLKPNNPLA